VTLQLMNLSKKDFVPVNTAQCYSVCEQGSKAITFTAGAVGLTYAQSPTVHVVPSLPEHGLQSELNPIQVQDSSPTTLLLGLTYTNCVFIAVHQSAVHSVFVMSFVSVFSA